MQLEARRGQGGRGPVYGNITLSKQTAFYWPRVPFIRSQLYFLGRRDDRASFLDVCAILTKRTFGRRLPLRSTPSSFPAFLAVGPSLRSSFSVPFCQSPSRGSSSCSHPGWRTRQFGGHQRNGTDCAVENRTEGMNLRIY